MKEHEHSYWGEDKKYWKHDNEREFYLRGAKNFRRGMSDAIKGESYSPPTRKHEDSYGEGHATGKRKLADGQVDD